VEQGGVDPHVWQDPRNVIRWTENAAEALSRLDPAGEADYRMRADVYQTELEQMDAEIQAMVGTVPVEQRKLVTDHDDMGYFADRYGFTIVGAVIPAYSTSAEPSAREISQLETRSEGRLRRCRS
jgi:ABC-type Zn uptake system ZnuABC Zn-binding protein ZnuA